MRGEDREDLEIKRGEGQGQDGLYRGGEREDRSLDFPFRLLLVLRTDTVEKFLYGCVSSQLVIRDLLPIDS